MRSVRSTGLRALSQQLGVPTTTYSVCTRSQLGYAQSLYMSVEIWSTAAQLYEQDVQNKSTTNRNNEVKSITVR